MLKAVGEQRAYLDRPFVFGCSTTVFPPEEIEALSKLGNLLEALVSGAVRPATREQEHFIRAHREEVEPVNVHERAWLRLKGRREFEQDEKKTTETAPPEDYGMVEFDADRCWW